LDYSNTRNLPIYYSCDWDYHGLCIIYPIVKEKIPKIRLLTPNGKPKSIVETEHKSYWKVNSNEFDVFLDENQMAIVKDLIKKDQWIIEESNNVESYFEELLKL
jgi:hypothetical protein